MRELPAPGALRGDSPGLSLARRSLILVALCLLALPFADLAIVTHDPWAELARMAVGLAWPSWSTLSSPLQATAPLPLFSHYQTRHHGDVLCPGGSFREGSYDRLMLRGRRHYESAFPWASKVAQGFWQGHPYCGRHRFGRCSRYLLSHLSAQLLERNRSALLNVGMTFYEEKLDQHLKSAACGCKQGWAHPGDLPRPATPLTKRPWVRIEHHARYRYLLQLDGHTCSWRFQYLLATNSPVLKQSSSFWEYYYGALTPGVHYEPFWTQSSTDVLDVLAKVDALLRRVRRFRQ